MDPDPRGTKAYYLFLNEMSVDPDPETLEERKIIQKLEPDPG